MSSRDESQPGEPQLEMKESSKPEEMVLDRDRLMNDFTNTGVMAALVGGFALGEFAEDRGDDLIAGIRTVLMFIAVHACTYAAICSALFYRAVNLLSDQGAEEWGRDTRHWHNSLSSLLQWVVVATSSESSSWGWRNLAAPHGKAYILALAGCAAWVLLFLLRWLQNEHELCAFLAVPSGKRAD